MSNIIFRNDLLKSFTQLQNNFQKSLEKAQDKDRKFKDTLFIFQENLRSCLEEPKDKISKTNPLYQSINDFIALLEGLNSNWETRTQRREKGIKFRSGFNDSLLIFVYGKVKSGKSSLGNYVAWGNTDPDDNIKKNVERDLIPKYFSHEKTNVKEGDSSKEAEIKKEFRVGATEATSSIQGFQLAGLTWVDSPGLHSVNEENGKLAKDYVDHADLILYTMKSDSPGRQSDLEEITELYQKGKKTLLLLTGSDETDEDEDENGNIITTLTMKDIERRRKQQQYIKDELSKIPELANEDIEIISFSARFAQEHQNDVEAFQDSGMGQLFSVIYQLTQSDGVKLKQRTPLNNFKNFLEEYKKDIFLLESLIGDFKATNEKVKKDFDKNVKEISYQAKNKMHDKIHELFNSIRKLQSDRQREERSKFIKKDLENYFDNILESSLNEIAEDVIRDFESSHSNTHKISNLVKLPEFSLQKRTETFNRVKRGNKKQSSGLGGLLGAIGGAFFGGPAGAAVGGMIGSAVGGVLGDDNRVESKSIDVVIGDNLSEIYNSTLKYPEMMEEIIKESAKEILGASLAVADTLLSNLTQEITSMDQNISVLLEEINDQLK